MRAAAGFRMELNAEGRNVCVGDSFNGSVVYVEERHFCKGRERSVFYSVAVVLAGDIYAACLSVFARVVAAAVSVFEFACFCSACKGQHLVAETDSEDWDNSGG